MRITYPDSGNLSGCARTLRILPRGMRRQGQGKRTKPRPIGGRRGACGAWPGFEPTRRAKLAARTASGRAAAHRHTQRPGSPAPGTPVGATSHNQGKQKPQIPKDLRFHRARGGS